jgi:hypothetical protein
VAVVRFTCVLVTVEDMQVGVPHQGQQLTHAGLASARLPYQQHRFLVAQAPAAQPYTYKYCVMLTSALFRAVASLHPVRTASIYQQQQQQQQQLLPQRLSNLAACCLSSFLLLTAAAQHSCRTGLIPGGAGNFFHDHCRAGFSLSVKQSAN